MSGLPQELIFLLIVGLFWLAQFVRQQQRRQEPPATDAERAAQAAAEPDEPPAPAPRPPAVVPVPTEGPWRAPPPRERQALVPPAPVQAGTRRYSRRALMGDRRAVQNAIVTAAILQPCRARRPHGMD